MENISFAIAHEFMLTDWYDDTDIPHCTDHAAAIAEAVERVNNGQK